MKLFRYSPGAVSLAVALWAISGAGAAEFRRLDGVHRIEKKVVFTQRAMLLARDKESGACGTGMQLCPSSLDGGCCPDNYDCAKESCYATTKGPSTCGTKVGWYACQPVYGGGCCPDGLLCETAGNCIPPSGVSYTYTCPASHRLCPSSMGYGCCPTNMGCARNQCYSTEATTITTEMAVTATEDGDTRTYTTKTTTVKEPDMPTKLPDVDVGAEGEQQVLKYFPSSVPKETDMASSDSDDDDDDEGGGGGGGLSKGQLAGIVTGAVAFLILVIVVAFIIIRHLNKVVAAVGTPNKSASSRARPGMKQYKHTDSEVDALSVDPLMLNPRSAHRRQGSAADVASSTDETPSSFAGGYHPVSTANSRHTSWDGAGNIGSYFDGIPARNARFSVQSSGAGSTPPNRSSPDPQGGAYTHVRHWSNASDESTEGTNPIPNTLLTELEATSVVPELPGSPGTTAMGSPTEDQRRRSNSSVSISSVMVGPPPGTHQRMRSGTARGNELGIVDEEIHGFHGPQDRMAGQTGAHQPSPGGP